jgi:hypothetical protein
MSYPKICEVIDILESDNFNLDAIEFEIDQCATLRGKLRWALLATKLVTHQLSSILKREGQQEKVTCAR